MRHLVLTPHADDETIGMGGTISKLVRTGDDVVVMLMADQPAERRVEFETACSILDASPLSATDLGLDASPADTNLDVLFSETVDLAELATAAVEPETLWLPFPSQHQDHQATYKAGLIAARISMSGAWFVPNVMVYDEAVSELHPWETGLDFGFFVELTAIDVHQKIDALAAYQSQLGRQEVASADYVHAEAITHGGLVGVRYAERFAVRRMVR